MTRLLLLLAATTLGAPAIAQHHGHHPPAAPKAQPKPAPKPAPRKPAPKKPAKKTPARTAPKPAEKPAADPHAGHATMAEPAAPQPADPHQSHDMGAGAAASLDPHAGHAMPAPAEPAADPHAGHAMPAADPHTGHAMPEPAPPQAPPPPAARSGPAHAADAVYGDAAMAQARAEMREMHGGMDYYKVLVDRAEVKLRDGRDGYAWDAQAWYGGDIDKIWFKTEGEGSFGESAEQTEVQALWSHAIDPWFDLQLGVRHDFRPDPERSHLVVGVQGLAPYWFEIDAAAFLSDEGDVTGRFEAEYDLRLTRKLILQPRAELDLALQDVPEIGVGSSLSSAELGARLRYEIRPELAPYIGIEYERSFGDTADFVCAAGEDAGGWSFLIGLRTWF